MKKISIVYFETYLDIVCVCEREREWVRGNCVYVCVRGMEFFMLSTFLGYMFRGPDKEAGI